MKAIVRMTACAAAAAAAMLLGVQVRAADGIVLVQKFTYADKPPQTHQIQIDQKHIRTESTGPDGSKAVVIFDSTRQVMTMVSDANKSYSEFSKADMEAAAAQMNGAMAQMQEMMKNLPPERRAQMEAAMKGRMGGAGPAPAAPARPEFKKVGTGTVGKWTCDKYEGYTNGQKTHEVCTVDPKVLGFSPADFQVTRDMVAFFKQLTGPMMQQVQQSQSQTFALGTVEEQGFSGLPVRSVSTVNGNQVTFEIADVHREAFTDATFQPPAGYTKIDLFGGRGRRGR